MSKERQALAEKWFALEQQISTAQEAAGLANEKVSKLLRERAACASALLDGVGPNIGTRAFQVATRTVVVVRHGYGVQLQLIEEKE